IIQYQTVRYDILPLSPISRNRLSEYTLLLQGNPKAFPDQQRNIVPACPGSSPGPPPDAVKRKILVLDLDETLIHSHHDGVLRPTVRPGTPPDFILKVMAECRTNTHDWVGILFGPTDLPVCVCLQVVIDKHPVRFFVHKRPHVDFFLEVVSQWYELVVFTASMEIYGSAVADKLDNNRNILKRRYYRQHCTLDLGSYIKDLSVVHDDLSSIVILDNSPGAYRSHPDNAIPIKSWFSDPSDTALLNLLPMLDALRCKAGRDKPAAVFTPVKGSPLTFVPSSVETSTSTDSGDWPNGEECCLSSGLFLSAGLHPALFSLSDDPPALPDVSWRRWERVG
ncbi:hypothetical protein CCH79_00012967, partial [Gambusia affinis]